LEKSRTNKKTINKSNKKLKSNAVINKGNCFINKTISNTNPKLLSPAVDNTKNPNIFNDYNQEEEKNANIDENVGFSFKKEIFKSINLKEIENVKGNYEDFYFY